MAIGDRNIVMDLTNEALRKNNTPEEANFCKNIHDLNASPLQADQNCRSKPIITENELRLILRAAGRKSFESLSPTTAYRFYEYEVKKWDAIIIGDKKEIGVYEKLGVIPKEKNSSPEKGVIPKKYPSMSAAIGRPRDWTPPTPEEIVARKEAIAVEKEKTAARKKEIAITFEDSKADEILSYLNSLTGEMTIPKNLIQLGEGRSEINLNILSNDKLILLAYRVEATFRRIEGILTQMNSQGYNDDKDLTPAGHEILDTVGLVFVADFQKIHDHYQYVQQTLAAEKGRRDI